MLDVQNFYKRGRLSVEDKNNIIDVLREDLGTSMTECARITGVKYSSVRTAYGYLGVSAGAVRSGVARKERGALAERVAPLYREGKSRKQIAGLLGVTTTTVAVAVAEAGLVKGRVPRHGTATEYGHWGCRCAQCTVANRLRCYRVKESMQSPDRVGEIPHGTMSGYWNWACRCSECVAVGSEIQRLRLATPVESQWNKGARWADVEDAAIESYDSIARELAVSLGRTTAAVNVRRAGRGIRKAEVEVLSR